jgi:ABC-type phosphate transport system auxiliary subunit
MIPAGYKLAAQLGGVLLLMTLAAGVVWWGMAPRIDIEAQRADTAKADLAQAEQLIELQAGVLAQQQKTLGDLAELERRLQLLGQAVDRNRAAQVAAFAELKRNDKAVADYLAGAVPAALGRLYERPETTDPAAYTAPAGVQPSAVPAPVSPTGVGQ